MPLCDNPELMLNFVFPPFIVWRHPPLLVTILVNLLVATGNHLKQSLLNQASSDSELAKHRTKLSHSLSNIANDVIFRKGPNEKDSVISSSKQAIFLTMPNVKHNVTEKVAQVSIWHHPQGCGCFDHPNRTLISSSLWVDYILVGVTGI